MKTIRTLLLSATLVAQGLLAQTPATPPPMPEQLDLDAAIAYGLENNFSIQQARERIREQEGLIVEVRALALPGATLSGTYGIEDRDLSDPPPASDRQSWHIGLDVRQTLYAGGGVRAALASQRLLREAALSDLQAAINDALLQIRTAFYDVLLTRDRIEVEEENIRLYEAQLNDVSNRLAAGTVSNFEVLRAEVELANAKPALITARNNHRIAIEQLRQAIGYADEGPESCSKTLEIIGTLSYAPVQYDLGDAIAQARVKRPELQQLDKLMQAREQNVRYARSGYLPDVALVGGYELRKSSSSSFSDSLDGWTVGLQSSWALFDGRATAGRVVQARSQVDQSRLQIEEKRLAVEVEVRQTFSSLQEARELCEASGKVVEQAEEALRLANARYSAGTATQLDVLSAQVALTRARNNQLQASYSHSVAMAAFLRATGMAESYTER